MGLDWVHPKKTVQQCYQACTEVESSQGKRNQGRPRNSWRRIVDNEASKAGYMHLEGDRKVDPKQKELAGNFHGPVLHKDKPLEWGPFMRNHDDDAEYKVG